MAWRLSTGTRFYRTVFFIVILICFSHLPLYWFERNLRLKMKKIELAKLQALHPLHVRDLHKIEQLILLPPFGLQNHEKTNFNEEYLNSSSLSWSLFFPDTRLYGAVDPRYDVRNETRLNYSPGKIWRDTDGNPIQAHGGGVLFDENSGIYYWYGENKNGPTLLSRANSAAPRVDVVGINCYSSEDLWAWKNEGIVLAAEDRDENHDLYKKKVIERPKVIYNKKTGKFVMWIHVDDASYTKAAVGVAVSDSPTGPFTYLNSRRPNGFDSGDMTVFKDDDGAAYLIYSSNRNKDLHISPLQEDYLDAINLTHRVLVGQHRQAPAVFKYSGIYYMITSGCSGLLPNEALVHEAESILGPWETSGNPCVGANRVYRAATFFSQGTFVLPMPGAISGAFIFMADRWNTADLSDSRYLWLPLTVATREKFPGLPLWSRVSIFWRKKWRIPLTIDEDM